jgi:hypothetical protein
LTSACCYWFFNEHLKISQEHAAKELEKLQAKIDDCNSRFSSIERHLGEKSFWDLSTMMVTPLQMKTLPQHYVYYKDIHCCLSVHDSASWNLIKVNGITMQILFGNPERTAESDPFFEFDRTRNIYFWKGPGSFKIHTSDVETPILNLFPNVFIEEFNNQNFSETITTVTEKLQTQITAVDQAFRESIQKLRDTNQKLSPNSDLPSQKGTSSFQNEQIASEKLKASIEELMRANLPPLTSDSSTFWASQVILGGFQFARKIPGASFQLMNIEKKENVFYLNSETVFPDSDSTPKIYWDQELFLIGTGQTTLMVMTALPWSADDRRLTEQAWIASWLAGLKVPLEQQ